MSESMELLDYRRKVAEMYRSVRVAGPSETAWLDWRAARDELFASHPQTPIEEPSDFSALPYFPFDPAWRVLGHFTPGDESDVDVAHSADGATRFQKVGEVSFELVGRPLTLEVLWLTAYGGGIFIPFRDLTNGNSTYGGGRYLIDSVKGADLGQTDSGLILDFNYAYHPSCVHSYRWSCPLAPAANHLDVEVAAGEMLRDAGVGAESR